MTDTEKVARALCEHAIIKAYTRQDRVEELAPFRAVEVDHLWRNHIPEAKAAIAAMQPAPQWYGIETAPRDGTFVLGFGPHNTRGSYREVIHWWGDRWTITWMEGYGEPTHWMPLPTPPAGGSDAE